MSTNKLIQQLIDASIKQGEEGVKFMSPPDKEKREVDRLAKLLRARIKGKKSKKK